MKSLGILAEKRGTDSRTFTEEGGDGRLAWLLDVRLWSDECGEECVLSLSSSSTASNTMTDAAREALEQLMIRHLIGVTVGVPGSTVPRKDFVDGVMEIFHRHPPTPPTREQVIECLVAQYMISRPLNRLEESKVDTLLALWNPPTVKTWCVHCDLATKYCADTPTGFQHMIQDTWTVCPMCAAPRPA